MLTYITTAFKELITNRYLTTLAVVTVVLMVGFVVYILLSVQPSELQLVTHYTAFGVTQLYRDQWFYLWSFGLFAILAAALHIALAIKLYITKGHPLALMIAWFGIGIILFAWVMSFSIINVWSPVS
ncbi:hypothetical protein CL689_01520 [Candidatus Saccharibacteria bacterium]|nr:hypothetical protein [Candidatus Saccharibacteria bacterium]MBQ68727.1 hypothetical protein [Candidatus Saccharibacteria bacterium]|tara:strand:+ start:841 stop:1221 length:381 start_codon:yes stop_codon:yes gene_type:complete